jgi:hypothetical protein
VRYKGVYVFKLHSNALPCCVGWSAYIMYMYFKFPRPKHRHKPSVDIVSRNLEICLGAYIVTL